MTTARFSHINAFVPDQDAALAFYTDKLGFEVGADQDAGFMRWLTVHPAGQPEVQLILCNPADVGMSPEKVQLLERVRAEGLGGGPLMAVEDCRAIHAELSARGVTFTQEPNETPYGIDCELTDPFGNRIRLVQAPEAG